MKVGDKFTVEGEITEVRPDGAFFFNIPSIPNWFGQESIRHGGYKSTFLTYTPKPTPEPAAGQVWVLDGTKQRHTLLYIDKLDVIVRHTSRSYPAVRISREQFDQRDWVYVSG